MAGRHHQRTRRHLRAASLLMVTAVAGIGWILVSTAHRQDTTRTNAVQVATSASQQAQQVLDPLVALCARNDDVARELRSARTADGRALCSAATQVKDSPEIAHPAALVGVRGLTGAQGPAGVAGLPGELGPRGPAGPMGPQGQTGPTGPAGPMGPAGIDGRSGRDGSPGRDGHDGQSGSMLGDPPAGRQGHLGRPAQPPVAPDKGAGTTLPPILPNH